MYVTKPGDPRRTRKLLEFVCMECGAEFICGLHEAYQEEGDEERYRVHCPHCYEWCYTTGRR